MEFNENVSPAIISSLFVKAVGEDNAIAQLSVAKGRDVKSLEFIKGSIAKAYKVVRRIVCDSKGTEKIEKP